MTPNNPPPKTDEQRERFCGMITIGCDRETAGKFLDWSPADLRRELQDAGFARKLARAEAAPEFRHMRNLYNAAEDVKHWRVSIWWLERCVPHRYARRPPGAISTVEMRRIVDKLADVVMAEVASPDDRQQVLDRLAQVSHEVEYDLPPAAELQFPEADDPTDDQ